MLKIRKSADRGYFNHGWLQTHHSFSFGHYYDHDFMGYGDLRVINEDFIEPSRGFGTHPHDNMEIITYIVSGSLRHKDSTGSGAILKRGNFQYMRAGSGITHSEHNASDVEMLHLLQIWIHPSEKGLEPGYSDHFITDQDKKNRFLQLLSSNAENGIAAIHQDVNLYASILKQDQELIFDDPGGRQIWLQLIYGELNVNGEQLNPGDAIYGDSFGKLVIAAKEDSEFLLFDMQNK